jgi:hypothetical protein
MAARYLALNLVSWVPAEGNQFLTITTEMVDGQRIRPAATS